MGRSQESFSKREKEKKKAKKKKEKQLKREQRQEDNVQGGSLDDMIAYVDEFGNLTDTPPEEQEREEIEAEDIVIGVPKKEDSGEPDVNVGTVAFYDSSKGFGFINDNNSGEKYFFHVNNVTFDIQENDKVTFDIVRGRKGMDAVNVALA
ncbi:cold-shock protein [Brumimicrobium sp.]|uniref:cold-shock protein n=1 Tax=Brumimicrobium sp. TaxID=2029867 RepID=UPI0026206FEF|nr:cold shock domain-containing protein [uncultured Brumimicrobium sp.]